MNHLLRTISQSLALLFMATLLSLPLHAGEQQMTTNAEGEQVPLVINPAGRPGRDYTPVAVPNGKKAKWRINAEGIKVFHLTAHEFMHEFAPGLKARVWGYNGVTPGPVVEAVEGDRVRIYVTNKLPAHTTIHWHGFILPNGMDGVGGLTQPDIRPGETFMYEFTVRDPATYMYHPHHDTMTQEGMGLRGLFVVHPKEKEENPPQRDYALMVAEWLIEAGTERPNPNEMADFNILTINGKCFPGTQAMVAEKGERVRIRIGNLSAMDHHPIHLHGHRFFITETDGGAIPKSAQWPETTVLVAVGQTRTIEFETHYPGDWIMHCHMTHHIMNQMGHGIPNMVGADMSGVGERIRKLIPGYMPMGMTGMGSMGKMNMPLPPNSIPMKGKKGQYDYITTGGMLTMIKVREKLPADGSDPGWYPHPKGSVSLEASDSQLKADKIDVDAYDSLLPPPKEGNESGGHGGMMHGMMKDTDSGK